MSVQVIRRLRVKPWVRWAILAAAVVALITWFGIGAVLRHRIDDDMAFAPVERTPGASLAVDTAAALITREVDHYGWQPNDPWFYPTALLDNPGHFQSGLLWATSRFTFEIKDRVARLGAATRLDDDLQRASGLLQYPGDVWVLDLRAVVPAPSEGQYRDGRDALLAYNRRLSAGQAVFNARPDNLAAMLDRVLRDLGAEAASIDTHLSTPRFFVNNRADDLFYQIKGALYAYTQLTSALGHDFEAVIKGQQLEALWARAIRALNDAAALHPPVVIDAAPDGTVLASHLASQGYAILFAQARVQDLLRALRV